jgi:hypothetical protein
VTKPENSLAENQQLTTQLVQLSEPELVRLLNRVKALRKELRRIRWSDGEPVEAVRATQGLLKIWNDELDRILAAKQATDTYDRLRNWDNEGGTVGRPTAPLVEQNSRDKRHLVVADVEDVGAADRR